MRFGAARATVENLCIHAFYLLFAAKIAVVAQGEFGYCGENWIVFHIYHFFLFYIYIIVYFL